MGALITQRRPHNDSCSLLRAGEAFAKIRLLAPHSGVQQMHEMIPPLFFGGTTRRRVVRPLRGR